MKVDGTAKVCAVIGDPVEHSLSPALHNAAFSAMELPYVYVPFRVTAARLPEAIEGIRFLGVRGVSVTIPHKVRAMELMDAVDPLAEDMGALNTIVNDDGILRGYNTDGPGMVRALSEASVSLRERALLVIGTGGAARAIAFSAVREGRPAQLTLLGIDLEEMESLRADLVRRTEAEVRAYRLTDASLRKTVVRADGIFQCTPVGMSPREGESLVPTGLIRPDQFVCDAVYVPARTRLIEEAEQAEATVIPGTEMFLYQAAIQFELWTGCDAPLGVMRQVLDQAFER